MSVTNSPPSAGSYLKLPDEEHQGTFGEAMVRSLTRSGQSFTVTNLLEGSSDDIIPTSDWLTHAPGTPVDCTLIDQSTNQDIQEGSEVETDEPNADRTLCLFNIREGKRFTSPDANYWLALLGAQGLKKKHERDTQTNNTSITLKFEPELASMKKMEKLWSRKLASKTDIVQRSDGTWEPKYIHGPKFATIEGTLHIDEKTLDEYLPRTKWHRRPGPIEVPTGLIMKPWALTRTKHIDWPHCHLDDRLTDSQITATMGLLNSGTQSALSVV